MRRAFSHVVGIDDGAHTPGTRGDVLVVAAVFAAEHLQGVLCDKVRCDGANSTAVVQRMLLGSRFAPQLQLVLLQGITLAGFNVVDIRALHATLGIPVLVVSRRKPDLEAIRRALLGQVPGGARKWRLIEAAGPLSPMAGVYVQGVGISPSEAEEPIRRLAVNGRIPEPLRTAHLIASGISQGESRQRV